MNFKITVRDLCTIAVCVAVAYVMGKFLSVLYRVIPFSRTYINAPFFTFLVSIMLYRLKKPGVLSMFAIVYGLLMARMSIFSTVAIAAGGILADVVMSLVLMGNFKNRGLALAFLTPLYSVGGVIGTWLLVITGVISNRMYSFGGLGAMLIMFAVVYALGLIGSMIAYNIYRFRLKKTETASHG